MQRKLNCITLLFCLLSANLAYSQLASPFSYHIRFSMKGYNMPLKKLVDNFKNPGIALGVDYAYNSKQSALQSFNIGWLNHSEHGNSLYVSSQFHYRPAFGHLRPGLGVGLGRMIYFNNTNPLYEQLNGKWQKSGSQIESRWLIPISSDLGYEMAVGKGYRITPFVGYELMPVIKYNPAFPILPSSLLTVGSRFNLPKK